MKPEILDSLLLDRALGELSPEAAALLDAYLAQNPADAARAAGVTDTLATARRALAVPAPMPRPLDVTSLFRQQRARRLAARRSEVLRLAACLMIGLGLGSLLPSGRPSPSTVPTFAVAARPSPVLRTAETPARFWSVDRFAPEIGNLPTRRKP